MIGSFKTTSDRDIAELLEKPKRIEKFICGEYFPEVPAKKGFFSFLRKKESAPQDSWNPSDPGEEFDVDKAWQGIHYILTGSAYEGEGPLAFILSGGKEVGDIDVGYGPARVFTSKEVEGIVKAMSSISDEEAKARCVVEDFKANEIYPDMWDEPFDECFGYILSYLEDLRDFLAKAVEGQKALVVYMN